ncbi:hypothetical protein G6F22_021114 [Rhizopus arrhizus]|nr:hypothetical protein G6F22_021114 [Rhizopus arrhizus]KAG1244598.1 hypothetical protein G6F65_021711 [Rhizopus arrhizus]
MLTGQVHPRQQFAVRCEHGETASVIKADEEPALPVDADAVRRMAWIDAIGQHGIQRQEFLFVGQGATGADIKAEEAVGAALRHIQRLAVGRDH